MLRVTSEPKDSELVTLMQSDSLGRNKDLGNLIRLLDGSKEGRSIFLDGPWGCGKSYFVRQAELLLRGMNTELVTPVGITRDVVDKVLSSAEYQRMSERRYLPVYFNSWRHDSYGEPVLSLMADIADLQDVKQEGEWNAEAVRDLLVSIAKCLFKVAVPGGSELLKEGSGVLDAAMSLRVSAEDPLQEYRARKKLEDYVGNLIERARKEAGQADAVVLFVDELDRCRPTYAVEVLESVKHLLVRQDVIVVFSLDASQLAETVRGLYGVGYDASRYLRRFYDVSIRLPEVSGKRFAEGVLKRPTSGGMIDDNVLGELVSLGDLTLRDVAQLYEMHGRVGNVQYLPSDDLFMFVVYYLRPFVCYLQTVHVDDLKSIVDGGVVSDLVLDYVIRSRTIAAALDRLCGERGVWEPPRTALEGDEARRRLFEDLLLVFLAAEGTTSRAEALRRVHMVEDRVARCRRLVQEVLELPTMS